MKRARLVQLVSWCICLALMLGMVCFAEEAGGNENYPWLVIPTRETLKVGFSQSNIDGPWRVKQNEDMEAVSSERGYELVITNAEGSVEKQLSDIEDLMAQGCNVLVLVPIDADAILPALEKAKEKGIPVILTARGANAEAGVDYVTGIMSDFVWEGEQAALWCGHKAEELGWEQIRCIEICGTIGGTDVRDRSDGFHKGCEEIGEHMQVVASQTANWSPTEAQKVMQNLIQSTGGEFEVVYCHNDQMAYGVMPALKSAGIEVGKDCLVASVDGEQMAVEYIANGELSCTVTCNPCFGASVFDSIEALIDGEKIDPEITNPDRVVSAENAEEELPLAW